MEAKKMRVVRLQAPNGKELDNVVNEFLIKEDDKNIVDIKPIDTTSVLIIYTID